MGRSGVRVYVESLPEASSPHCVDTSRDEMNTFDVCTDSEECMWLASNADNTLLLLLEFVT
jgi:hypothetical protein